jgi:hypothetical protein
MSSGGLSYVGLSCDEMSYEGLMSSDDLSYVGLNCEDLNYGGLNCAGWNGLSHFWQSHVKSYEKESYDVSLKGLSDESDNLMGSSDVSLMDLSGESGS